MRVIIQCSLLSTSAYLGIVFVKVAPGSYRGKVKESVKAIEEIGRVHRSSPVGKVSGRMVTADLLTHIYRLVPLEQPAVPRPAYSGRYLASAGTNIAKPNSTDSL